MFHQSIEAITIPPKEAREKLTMVSNKVTLICVNKSLLVVKELKVLTIREGLLVRKVFIILNLASTSQIIRKEISIIT